MKALNRILLVEDDCDLAHITEIFLTHAGYTVDIASTCAQAVSLLNQTAYQLVLLDSLLPDGKGNSLCPLIREKDGLCPIIFLSCLDDSNSIISALEHGGDDYMVKPFKHVELLARIQANLRKREAYEAHRKKQEKPHLYEFSTFTIDTDLGRYAGTELSCRFPTLNTIYCFIWSGIPTLCCCTTSSMKTSGIRAVSEIHEL